MIEVLEMPQGSAEWYEARRGIPTASEFGAIMAKGGGKVRRAYMMRLAAERITGEVQERYVSQHMQRGRDQEAEARDLYSFLTDTEPQLVGFIRDSGFGCSPDALIGDDGMLEIKTKLPSLQIEVLSTGGIPSEYRAQVQGGLWITGRAWCDFVCYSPGLPIHIARAARSEEYITILAHEVGLFTAELDGVVQRILTRPGQISTFSDQLERSAAL